MNANHARRFRFGILAARHMLERHRLTDWQVDDLEGCLSSGWKVSDSLKAFDAEFETATDRVLGLKPRAALRAHDRKAAHKRSWPA